MKLFDSELKVMEVLWEHGQKSAREIVDILSKRIGWAEKCEGYRGDIGKKHRLEQKYHLYRHQKMY